MSKNKPKHWALLPGGPANKSPRLTKKKVHGIPKSFFLGKKLYTRIRVKKHLDQIECWEHETATFVFLSYSYVLQNYKDFYLTSEVAALLWRVPQTIYQNVWSGKLRAPTKYVPIGHPKEDAMWYAWHEDEVFEAWEYFINTSWYGSGSPVPTPSKKELRAAMNQETVLYMQDDDGNFIPTWRS